jgi:ubiquinone/menaquinone biosynthesis C-methylase UbiE
MTDCQAYQTGPNPAGNRLTKRAMSLAGLGRGARVLEIGCGSGAIVGWLRDACHMRAVGIDRLLQSFDPGLPLLRADGKRLPFVAHRFDGVLAECSLSIMRNRPAVLAECARVLAPGGSLIITDVYARNPADPGKLITHEVLTHQLTKAGFRIRTLEDHTYVLKQYLVRFLMEDDPGDCVYSAVGDWRKSRPGYFLLIATLEGEHPNEL